MRAAIYNPYLDTLGGGERYTLAFVQVLVSLGYEVDIEWSSRTINPKRFWQSYITGDEKTPTKLTLEKFTKRYGYSLNGIKFVKDIKRGDGYDVCFWVSDGSIPLLRARKNFLHFQIPFKDVNGRSLLNKMKLFRVNKIICNSYFTKKFIDEEYGVESMVVYPPVDVLNIKPKRKENIILYVGRFSRLTQAKGQDILIKAFKKIFNSGYKEWKLVLAGGVEVGVDDYLDKIKKASEGYPIEFLEKPSFDTLKDVYGFAKIFWSASGYGVDRVKDPRKVEHFGISVVEGMSAGCVPLIFNAGGHKEIVAHEINGFLWKKPSDLINKTEMLIENSKLLREMSLKARMDSKVYEFDRFKAEVLEIIQK